jgi:hypothetical protein
MADFRFRRTKRQKHQRSEAEAGRLQLVKVAVQAVLAFMVVVVAVYAVVSYLIGQSVVIPSSAAGVLDSVTMPDHYGWVSESVRRVRFGGQTIEQDAYRAMVVDKKLNRFQAISIGVLPEKTRFISAGHFTTALTESAARQGKSVKVVTNVCGHEPTVPAAAAAFPTPQEVKAAHPSIASSEGDVAGAQAWVLDFQLTPTIIRKLLLLNFFDRVNHHYPALQSWVMSPSERSALARGAYTADFARAWVTRAEPRQLAQFDVRFRFKGGSAYRLLATLSPEGSTRALAHLNGGRVRCPPKNNTPPASNHGVAGDAGGGAT